MESTSLRVVEERWSLAEIVSIWITVGSTYASHTSVPDRDNRNTAASGPTDQGSTPRTNASSDPFTLSEV